VLKQVFIATALDHPTAHTLADEFEVVPPARGKQLRGLPQLPMVPPLDGTHPRLRPLSGMAVAPTG
jgi:hypothetical protein